jgi:opacity protein-like surface antigen
MRSVLLSACLVLALSSVGHAQWVQPIELYFGGGIDSPKEPSWFDGSFKGKLHFMFGAGMRSFPFMEVIGKYEHHRIDSDTPRASGGNVTAQLLGANGKLNWELPAFPVEPYALFGGGLSWLRQSTWEPSQPGMRIAGQTDLYYEVGGGAQAMVHDNYGLFAQARWVSVVLSQPNKSLGNSLRWYSVTIGFKWVEGI